MRADGAASHQLAELEAGIGVDFRDRSLLARALVHRSYLNENPEEAAQSNERLEFLGDAMIDLVVGRELFERLPEAPEGILTARRSLAVRGDALARVAAQLGLGQRLLMGHGERASGGAERISNLAGTLEAVVGAVLLDQGQDAATRFVLRVLDGEISAAMEAETPKDAKSLLQEFAQARGGQPPGYLVTGFEGPDHDRVWKVDAVVGGEVVARGKGHRKLDAEREAAAAALERLAARERGEKTE